jgi:hypothetical protein
MGMSIPFKGYLYSRQKALGHGPSWVVQHVFHDDQESQDFMITGCSVRVPAFNVSPGDPPTTKQRRCLCCDFGSASKPPKAPKLLWSKKWGQRSHEAKRPTISG